MYPSTSSAREKPLPRFSVLFGTQTGKAWYIAQDVYLNCKTAFASSDAESKIKFNCCSLEKFGTQFRILYETMIIFVVATVGEGECPYNSLNFWRYIRAANHPPNLLSKLNYGIFALGDSNYHHFAIFGKQLDMRLQQLGAKPICPIGFGDDAVGVELGYSPWLESVIEAFAKILPCNEVFFKQFRGPGNERNFMSFSEMQLPSQIPSELTLPIAFRDSLVQTAIKDDQVDPNTEELNFIWFPLKETDTQKVKLVDLKLISKPIEDIKREDKIILEATFEGDKDLVSWEPGDAFGFIAGYSDHEINIVLRALNLMDAANCIVSIQSKSHLYLPKEVSLYNLIKYYFDLRAIPKKANLRFLGDHCSVPSQRLHLHFLSSREGTEEYKKQILKNKTTILDILVQYSSCSPPLDYFIAMVPNYVPRFYSMINLRDETNRFKVAFTVIFLNDTNQRKDTQLMGLFTGMMYKIALQRGILQDDKIYLNRFIEPEFHRVFRKRNGHFKLSPDTSLSIIMVAVGTGITPFIGFLSARQRLRETRPEMMIGGSWVFYGCRDPEKDFIYSEELQAFKANGTLSRFYPCFSRNAEAKYKYVQDAIVQEKKLVRRSIVEGNAMIYVCGDLSKISVDVRAAFVSALDGARMGRDEPGETQLDNMRDDGRYLQDIWV